MGAAVLRTFRCQAQRWGFRPIHGEMEQTCLAYMEMWRTLYMEIVHSIMSYVTIVLDSSHLLEESMATRIERHTGQSDVINMMSPERI